MVRKEQIAVTATTGIAACNVGGQTLHSWAGIQMGTANLQKMIQLARSKARNWSGTKVLIIDEISMLSDVRFDNASRQHRTCH